jgi:WXXGXW repeat (2 copies)
MSNRKLWVAAGLLTMASALAPTVGISGVNVDIDVAPPAPQVEVAPPPRPGMVWAPGFWEWHGHNHVWVRGHWLSERPGMRWEADRWEQRGPHYHYVPGHWTR